LLSRTYVSTICSMALGIDKRRSPELAIVLYAIRACERFENSFLVQIGRLRPNGWFEKKFSHEAMLAKTCGVDEEISKVPLRVYRYEGKL